MAGYNRPTGGWNYVFNGINVVDEPDAIEPTQYPYARNIRGLADRSVRTRPGYTLFSTSPNILTQCPLPAGAVNSAYSDTFTAVGGVSPYTWAIVSGALPDGLALSSSGILSGTPTLSGLFTFGVRVTDAVGGTDIIDCSLYICPATGGNSDWSGCMTGSFTAPGDWFTVGLSITGGQAVVDSVSYTYKTANTCGVSLNQEVYLVYDTKTFPSGNHGYIRVGPGARMTGTILSNLSGYFYTATMWAGTLAATCGYANAIVFQIRKVVGGSQSVLANNIVPGTDLAPGIPFDIKVTNESGNARIVCALGGTEMFNILDSTAVLPTGAMGLACLETCGGVTPTVSYSFIKGQLL